MPVLTSTTNGYQVTTSPAKLCKRALRILGVIDTGEDLTAEELRDALEGFNHMLDSWNTERLVVPSLVLTSTSVSTKTVTIGPGADVDIYRPSKLETGQVFLTLGTVDYKLEAMSAERYAEYASLTGSGVPAYFYYDASSPTGSIKFDITPNTTYTLNTYTWKLLAQTELKDINGTFGLEPGYARAIAFNLALDLADEWGATPSQNLMATANTSKANLKSLNIEPILVDCDTALLDRPQYLMPDINRG